MSVRQKRIEQNSYAFCSKVLHFISECARFNESSIDVPKKLDRLKMSKVNDYSLLGDALVEKLQRQMCVL